MNSRDELIEKAKLLINKQAKEFYNEREWQGVDYVITWAADFALEQIVAERRRMFKNLWGLYQAGEEGDFETWFEQEFSNELAEVKDGR